MNSFQGNHASSNSGVIRNVAYEDDIDNDIDNDIENNNNEEIGYAELPLLNNVLNGPTQHNIINEINEDTEEDDDVDDDDEGNENNGNNGNNGNNRNSVNNRNDRNTGGVAVAATNARNNRGRDPSPLRINKHKYKIRWQFKNSIHEISSLDLCAMSGAYHLVIINFYPDTEMRYINFLKKYDRHVPKFYHEFMDGSCSVCQYDGLCLTLLCGNIICNECLINMMISKLEKYVYPVKCFCGIDDCYVHEENINFVDITGNNERVNFGITKMMINSSGMFTECPVCCTYYTKGGIVQCLKCDRVFCSICHQLNVSNNHTCSKEHIQEILDSSPVVDFNMSTRTVNGESINLDLVPNNNPLRDNNNDSSDSDSDSDSDSEPDTEAEKVNTKNPPSVINRDIVASIKTVNGKTDEQVTIDVEAKANTNTNTDSDSDSDSEGVPEIKPVPRPTTSHSVKKHNITYQIPRIRSCVSCSIPIEYTTGCKHMTCTRCLQHFCFVCLTKLSGGSDNHLSYHCYPHAKQIIS